MNKIDRYLLYKMKEQKIESFGENSRINNLMIPFLMRVKSKGWKPEGIPDLKIISRLGVVLACLGSRSTLYALEEDQEVISINASRVGGGLELDKSKLFIQADTILSPPLSEKGDQSIIAIIDSGIDILHEAFIDSRGNTRILEIWDQTDDSGTGPLLKNLAGLGQTFGTIHTEKDINKYIKKNNVPNNLGRDTDGHGTHVASIAAGSCSKTFPGGVAPEAKLLIVKTNNYIRVNPGDPKSLGYSIEHQTALQYIEEFAAKIKLPVVVNLSQGMSAGAHDGKSALEASFDSFSGFGRKRGRIIVKSAGNERGEDGHARLKLLSNTIDFLQWESKDVYRQEDYIELWFSSSDEFEFRLKDPNGKVSPVLRSGDNFSDTFKQSNNEFFMEYERYNLDNGDSKVTISIQPGPTRGILKGIWELEIESKKVKTNTPIDAWIERRHKRPIRFRNYQENGTTISIPGTAESILCVASVQNEKKPFMVSNFSSLGPTRDGREKPDLSAPGELICAAKCNTYRGVCSMQGTSMAAPHVSGAVALAFSCKQKIDPNTVPSAAQIRKILKDTAQNSSVNFCQKMGFGVLSVKDFLNSI
ncbi:S8 family serine peptidase [Desulfospira joergensenii]|uniref:S8 family serine peptidase n=1 Tax=Desulfospira joergensenii TaxID=53329 RepID=UPI0003B5E0D4|nr:S8 family serine peptidase [Desulfospira joergensenii]